VKRAITFILCALEALAWAAIAKALFFSGSDPATNGLDKLAGIAFTILFALTAVPAFLLALARRAPNLALGLALAFPACFALLFAAGLLLIS